MFIKSFFFVLSIQLILANINTNAEANGQIDEINEIFPVQYENLIQQINQAIELKNHQRAMNFTRFLFQQLFEGMKQCDETQNKTKLLNFLKQLNYPFETEIEFNQSQNIIVICSRIYEIYEQATKEIIDIQKKNNINLSEELKSLFNQLNNDYEGLKEAGLFDQLIFIEQVTLTEYQNVPQFEIIYIEYEQFSEFMYLHFSLIQAINALFEDQPIDVVLKYFEVLDIDKDQEQDMIKIQKMYLATYWNQVKEAAENEATVIQGWKKLYYQTVISIAQRLRDDCHYFEKQGVITKLERNSKGTRMYLPNIECEETKQKRKHYYEKSQNIDEL